MMTWILATLVQNKKSKEKREQQVFSQESLDKRSDSMKKHCQSHTWTRKK